MTSYQTSTCHWVYLILLIFQYQIQPPINTAYFLIPNLTSDKSMITFSIDDLSSTKTSRVMASNILALKKNEREGKVGTWSGYGAVCQISY